MEAVAVIRAIRGPKFGLKAGKSREVSTFINFEQPAWLRATGVVPPTGRKAFDLASDGREFHLLAPDHDEMKFVVGQVDAQLNESDISDIDEMARPREFLDAQGDTLASSVTFSASGLPADATASFNPATFPAGSSSGATTLTIATVARTATHPLFRDLPRPHPLALIWLTLLALAALFADRARRAERNGLRLRATGALLVLCCLLVAGCNSASESAAGTPAGTSTITVAATSGSATRITTVTLTVQ